MEMNENINLKRIFDILKHRKLLIVFTLIVFTVFGYLYSYEYLVPQYKSKSTLLLIPNTTSETTTNSDLTVNSGLISTYSSIATNSKVLKQVINNLKLDLTEDELLSKITVSVIKNTYIIEVVVTDESPRLSAIITRELANVFLNEIQEIYNLNNIGIIDSAQIPSKPYNINHKKDLFIFFCLGIIASFMLIIFIYIFNNKIEKEEEIEKYLHIKSLGSIPLNVMKKTQDEIVDKTDSKSYASECINTIRTNILYMNSTKNAKTILVTSCTPNEGKSWVSANVAASFADINKKVLLIDADMRKGRAYKIFGASNKYGLSEFLYSMTGDIKEDLLLANKFVQETKIPNLHILTNGNIPHNPSELLASSYMKELVALFKNTYDIIILDAPPCKLVTDSIILSTIVDSSVLVVNSSKTSINDIKEVKKSIELVDGEIIGAILNKVKMSGKTYKKNYYYGNSTKMENYNSEPQTVASVSELIDESLAKLAENNYNLFPEEDKVFLLEEDYNGSSTEHWIKQQNQYLEKLMGYIADMKVQFNYSTAQNQRDNKMKLDYIHDKLEQMHENSQHDNLSHTTNLNKITSDLENFKETYKEMSGELESIHTAVNINSKEILSTNTKALENIQANINTKTKEILDTNNKISQNIQSNINYKVDELSKNTAKGFTDAQHSLNNKAQELISNNGKSFENMQNSIAKYSEDIMQGNRKAFENMQYNINTKSQEIIQNNAKTLGNISYKFDNKTKELLESNEASFSNLTNTINDKTQELVENNKKSFDNMQYNINSSSQAIMQNNKKAFENVQYNINNKSQESMYNTNKAIQNIQNTINNNLQQAINNNTRPLANSVQENRQMMLALDQKIMKVQYETQNLLKQEIANINYSDKINEINNMIIDLKENYLELYNIIKSAHYKEHKNSTRYNENVINIQSLKNSSEQYFEKWYNIDEESIPYSELEGNALEIVPLKSRKFNNSSNSYENLV